MATNPGLASLFRLLRLTTAVRGGSTGFSADTSGFNGAINFEITGVGGATWHCVVGTGSLCMHAGAHAEPIGTVSVSVEDFFRLLVRETRCSTAALSGRLRVTGEAHVGAALAVLIEQLWSAYEEPGLAGWIARIWINRAMRLSGSGKTLSGSRT